MPRTSADWPDLVFATGRRYATVTAAVKAGRLRRLARGIYTPSGEPAAAVIRRHWREVLAWRLPGAVIVDASARTGLPDDRGYLYVDHRRQRPFELPGLVILPRQGPGPMSGDIALPDGTWQSSTERALLDNLARRDGRRLTASEVQDWVIDILAHHGEARLNELRDRARRLAMPMGREPSFDRLTAIISAALSTGPAAGDMTAALQASAAGMPYDRERLARFESCAESLAARAPASFPDLPELAARRRFLPIFEAYFSNYIEGTEFLVDEAIDIILKGAETDRPLDAHDVRGTYGIVGDPVEMARTPASADEFIELLRERHRVLMSARPEMSPGEFKTSPNRAGQTVFATPALTKGTLRAGFEAGQVLADPFARAVFMMFLVAEVHPFTDGNGRTARMMMNAELVVAGQVRIVIPTAYRGEYLSALKGATHSNAFPTLASVLAFAQRYTAQIDFSSLEAAKADLERTNAFIDPADGDKDHLRLRLPAQIDRNGH